MRLRLLLVALLSAGAAGTARAQRATVPVITLDKGAVEVPDPFSQLAGVIELRDGRVLALDMKEKELRLVDLKSGDVAPVSRLGGGPLEYQVPGILIRGAADTAAYYDLTQRRLLLFSPNGVPLRTVAYGTNAMAMLSMMQPAWADAAGRLYGVTLGMNIGQPNAPTAPTFSDSVEIQSFDVRTGKVESLARVRSTTAAAKPKMDMGPSGVKMSLTASDFSSGDTWTVLPDGKVAILRDGVYRVHFVATGRPEVLGPTVAHTPVPVTPSDRRAILDSVRKAVEEGLKPARQAAAQAGRGGAAMSIEAEVLEPERWATTKPPYASLAASPDAYLWVGQLGAYGDKSARFDVLTSSGSLQARVVLAAGETLIGLGRGVVFTIRTDADDLQYLRRYALPAPLAR